MTNDELAALRTLMREEIGASEQRTRVLIREEINAAVYASEQRLGERLEERLDRLEGGQRELRLDVARIDVQLSEPISILNDASRVINDLRFSQHALETKVEENLLGLRRDMQRLTESVHTFSRHFIAIDRATSERITTRERMTIDETHPYPPHSAA
jgi:hypothetical protein